MGYTAMCEGFFYLPETYKMVADQAVGRVWYRETDVAEESNIVFDKTETEQRGEGGACINPDA